MVLAQPELRAEVETGRIAFDPPLEESQWSQASVDLRLGFSFTKLKRLPGIKLSATQGFPGQSADGSARPPCQLTFFQLTSELPPRIAYGA